MPTKLQRPKSRYQLLREQSEEYVLARWSAGKTVLKWERKDPVPQFEEEELHDLSYDGRDVPWQHTPFQICRPDLQFMGEPVKLCDKCRMERDELVATSPPVAEFRSDDEDEEFRAYHDRTIDVHEQTIRQEFARHGILVLSPRPSLSDDGDDDPMTNAQEDKDALYTTVDAETIGLIELEKKMYMAGPVRSIGRDGDKLRMRGYEDLPIEEQREYAKDYLRKHKNRPYNAKRAQAQRLLTRKLNEEGKKATIFALYGITSVPREYYDVDEDPNRLVLHEQDMTMHDVHMIVEPIDPDLDPSIHALQPEDWQVLFFLRGKTVSLDEDPFVRQRQLRSFLAENTLHLEGGNTGNLWSDHELAETEWDLGVDFAEYEVVDPDWVQALMADQST